MKTKEELSALRKDFEALSAKLAELTEEELDAVTGGARPFVVKEIAECGAPLGRKPLTAGLPEGEVVK